MKDNLMTKHNLKIMRLALCFFVTTLSASCQILGLSDWGSSNSAEGENDNPEGYRPDYTIRNVVRIVAYSGAQPNTLEQLEATNRAKGIGTILGQGSKGVLTAGSLLAMAAGADGICLVVNPEQNPANFVGPEQEFIPLPGEMTYDKSTGLTIICEEMSKLNLIKHPDYQGYYADFGILQWSKPLSFSGLQKMRIADLPCLGTAEYSGAGTNGLEQIRGAVSHLTGQTLHDITVGVQTKSVLPDDTAVGTLTVATAGIAQAKDKRQAAWGDNFSIFRTGSGPTFSKDTKWDIDAAVNWFFNDSVNSGTDYQNTLLRPGDLGAPAYSYDLEKTFYDGYRVMLLGVASRQQCFDLGDVNINRNRGVTHGNLPGVSLFNDCWGQMTFNEKYGPSIDIDRFCNYAKSSFTSYVDLLKKSNTCEVQQPVEASPEATPEATAEPTATPTQAPVQAQGDQGGNQPPPPKDPCSSTDQANAANQMRDALSCRAVFTRIDNTGNYGINNFNNLPWLCEQARAVDADDNCTATDAMKFANAEGVPVFKDNQGKLIYKDGECYKYHDVDIYPCFLNGPVRYWTGVQASLGQWAQCPPVIDYGDATTNQTQ